MDSGNVEVLLCDIGLPDGTGYELAHKPSQSSHSRQWPLLASAPRHDIRRSKEAGFDFHLVKPINFQELQTVLDQAGA